MQFILGIIHLLFNGTSESTVYRFYDPGCQPNLANAAAGECAAANPELEQELDDILQATEQQLLDYLLAGAPPTPLARQRAQHFLDMAQHQLLGSTLDVQQLLAELATTRLQEPPPPPSTLPS